MRKVGARPASLFQRDLRDGWFSHLPFVVDQHYLGAGKWCWCKLDMAQLGDPCHQGSEAACFCCMF